MPKTWIVPLNSKCFNLEKYLHDHKQDMLMDWSLKNRIYNGDLVLIYVSGGEHAIFYKAMVVLDDVDDNDIIDNSAYSLNDEALDERDMRKTIRLKFSPKFMQEQIIKLKLAKLRENGLKSNLQSAIILDMNPELSNYILSVIGTL